MIRSVSPVYLWRRTEKAARSRWNAEGELDPGESSSGSSS